MKVGRRRVEIGNPDKELFPEPGLTKKDLAEYYRRVSDVLLSHAEDRPITMHRFPDGIEGEDFYQKNVPDHFPDWIRTERVETKDEDEGPLQQLLLEKAADLVYLADQGCITLHAWLSRIDRLDHPDRMIFDLDPPEDADLEEGFGEVRWTARRIRELLDEVELASFVQTSGSKGLHVHVPLDRSADFDAVRGFAQDLAALLARRHPDALTTAKRKDDRRDRIFLDVARNAYGQTAVLPYSVRARPGAPVAAPLEWDELGRSGMHPRRYTVGNLFQRLGRVEDPWQGIGRHRRALEGPREALDELLEVEEEEKEG